MGILGGLGDRDAPCRGSESTGSTEASTSISTASAQDEPPPPWSWYHIWPPFVPVSRRVSVRAIVPRHTPSSNASTLSPSHRLPISPIRPWSASKSPQGEQGWQHAHVQIPCVGACGGAVRSAHNVPHRGRVQCRVPITPDWVCGTTSSI